MIRHFHELDVSQIRGAVVLLDIDGSLLPDGERQVTQETRCVVEELRRDNEVYLCTNSRDHTRNKALAEDLGLPLIGEGVRKPSRKILRELRGDRPVVVVGDKWITDGRQALVSRGSYVRVLRHRHGRESIATRCAYALDDIWYRVERVAIRHARPYVTLMRPVQWVKNGLIFAPLLFAGVLFDVASFTLALLLAACFSLLASGIYVINDLFDHEQDALHPEKRHRPLPSGRVRRDAAWALGLGLLALSSVTSLALFSTQTSIVLGLYAALNLAYTRTLKHIAILDIVAVATSYVLRVVAGGVVIGVVVSGWIVLCTFFAALFVVIGKRRAEMVHAHTRKVLESYSAPVLDHLFTIAGGMTLASYGVYTIVGHTSPYLVYTVILATIGILRYALIVHTREGAEYPERLLLRDRVMVGTFGVWLVTMAVLFSGGSI